MKTWTKHLMVGFTAMTVGFSGVALEQIPVTVEASAKTTYKTTDNLNLRTGSSVKHKRITTIPKGQTVVYLGKQGSWYKVNYGNKTGYVSSKYLTSTKKSAVTKVSNSAVSTYSTTANLNLRKGASIKQARILTIPKGKKVSYIGKSGSWYKVKYNSKTGYVSAKYLKKATTNKTAPKPSVTPVSNKAGFVKKVMDVEVTAYTFNSGANRTASGKKLQVGDVSAPREIPFGSIVDIPGIEKQLGVKELKVYDRGGAIKRLGANKIRIDVAFPNRSQALKFGRKTYKNVTVYVKK